MTFLQNTIVFLMIFLFGSFKKDSPITLTTTTIKAPFGTVKVTAPNFSKSPQLSIIDFGAEKGIRHKMDC